MNTARLDLEEYRDIAPKGTVDFLYRLSELVKGRRFLQVTAVRYGGGMPEVLRRLMPMLVSLGVEARWEVLTGDQEFFSATRRLVNALQGQEDEWTDEMAQIYLKITDQNARALNLDADLVMIHDPEPAALIEHRKGGNWIWR